VPGQCSRFPRRCAPRNDVLADRRSPVWGRSNEQDSRASSPCPAEGGIGMTCGRAGARRYGRGARQTQLPVAVHIAAGRPYSQSLRGAPRARRGNLVHLRRDDSSLAIISYHCSRFPRGLRPLGMTCGRAGAHRYGDRFNVQDSRVAALLGMTYGRAGAHRYGWSLRCSRFSGGWVIYLSPPGGKYGINNSTP